MTDRKANTVMLNAGLFAGDAPPEADVASVVIDGTPIHNVVACSIGFGVDRVTRVHLVFEAKVGGLAVEQILKAKHD